MTSLTKCVEEFLNHHASTFLPSDSNDTRRPRYSRFDSNPISSETVFDEDPSSLRFDGSFSFIITIFIQIFTSSHRRSNIFFDFHLDFVVNSFTKFVVSIFVRSKNIFDLVDSTGSSSHLSSDDGNGSRYSRSFTLFRRWTSTRNTRSQINCSFRLIIGPKFVLFFRQRV